MSAIFRIIKFSFQDIVRNISLSFMTVLILILMLLSINTLIVVRVLTAESVNTVKDQIDVSIYFNVAATDEQVQELRGHIASFPEVTGEKFLNREEVLEEFKNSYRDNVEVLASLEELEENPFGPTLIVKTREPEDYEKIISAISVPEYEDIVESKTFGDTQKAIERIHTITSQVERFTYLLTGLFAVIAFIIIFNTIRVAIYTHRAEISIKRLVGATTWFIRGPYIVESFLFSVVSICVTGVILYVALDILDPFLGVIFQKPALLTDYFSSHIVWLAALEFGAVFLLTIFSSTLAMGKYLRV